MVALLGVKARRLPSAAVIVIDFVMLDDPRVAVTTTAPVLIPVTVPLSDARLLILALPN